MEILKKNLKKLAEIGYTGLFHDEKYGGTAKDLVTQSVAQEELAKVCASTYLSVGASVGLCGIPIAIFGTEEQKKKYLPGLITTDLVGCFGLTEPEAGSDAISIKTTAVKKGKSWVLNGSKMFITNGSIADVAVVMAKTDPTGGKGRNVSSFIVEKGTKGFKAGKPMDKMGYRGSPTAELIFEECEIPAGNLLGVENEGFMQAMKTLEYGRIGMAMVCLGVSMACMEESIKYAKERVQFGRPISKFQMISFKIADMKLLTDVGAPVDLQGGLAQGKQRSRRGHHGLHRQARVLGDIHPDIQHGGADPRRLRLHQGVSRSSGSTATPSWARSARGPRRSSAS